MNITKINQHFVKVEILSRGLPVKTAIGETARAFGLTEPEIESAVLLNTGCDSLKKYEEIHSGKLQSGDFVLNADPQNGAFDIIVIADGQVFAEQCHLVLRRTSAADEVNNCAVSYLENFINRWDERVKNSGNLNELIDELASFCKREGLPHLSANELIHIIHDRDDKAELRPITF